MGLIYWDTLVLKNLKMSISLPKLGKIFSHYRAPCLGEAKGYVQQLIRAVGWALQLGSTVGWALRLPRVTPGILITWGQNICLTLLALFPANPCLSGAVRWSLWLPGFFDQAFWSGKNGSYSQHLGRAADLLPYLERSIQQAPQPVGLVVW